MRLNFHEHEGQAQHLGSVAEWSKALVLGTSLFGGVGSNPTAANLFYTKLTTHAL